MSDRNDRSDRLRRRLDDEPDASEEDTATDESPAADDEPAAAEGEEQPSSSSSKSSQSSKTAKPVQTNKPGRESVKDRPSVLMYLPNDLRQEMDIRYDEVNATVKRARGEGVEKNRDWYPLVVTLGLEKADELGDDELLTRLDEADY